MVASGSSIHDWTNAVLRVDSAQYRTPQSAFQVLYAFGVKKGEGFTGVSDTAAALRFVSGQLMADTFEECMYPFVAAAVNHR